MSMAGLFVCLVFPTVVLSCVPLQNSSYRHSTHLASMNLSIFFDQDLDYMAEEVFCLLNSSFAVVNRHPLKVTASMKDICQNSSFAELLRFTGLVQVTVTIGRVAKAEEEAICTNITANLLYLKVREEQWLAHLITRRSDHLIDLGNSQDRLIPRGLTKAIELMAAISGPVLTLPQTGVYKTQQEAQKRQREAAGHWIKVLVGVGVGGLLIVVVAMAATIGTVAYRKRAKRKEEKSKQLAEKTRLNEGELVLDLDEEEAETARE